MNDSKSDLPDDLSPVDRRESPIITFYSYKGGVGRSMAVANVAVLLSRDFNRDVVVVDWDLEAPGLHRFFQIPEELKVDAQTQKGKNPTITIEGYDKQLVGQVAAKIRALRKVEPYKGKGIRFAGEIIRRKAGKAAAAK